MNSNDVPTVVQLNAVFKADDVKHREKQIQEEFSFNRIKVT